LGDGAGLGTELVGMGGRRTGTYTGTGTYVMAGEGMVGIALSAGVVSVDSVPGEGGTSMAGSGNVEGVFSGLGEGMVAIDMEGGLFGLGLRTTGVEGCRSGVGVLGEGVARRTDSGDDADNDANREEFRTGRTGGDV